MDGIAAWITDNSTIVQALASAVTAVATIVLVVITFFYARAARRANAHLSEQAIATNDLVRGPYRHRKRAHFEIH